MKQWTLAFRLLKRDARAGELTLLATALWLAVTGLTATALFGDRLQRAMTSQTAEFLAADLVVESPDPVPKAWLQQAQSLGLRHAQTVEFSSMLIENGELLLVSAKAVTDHYPLRGHLRTREAESSAEITLSHGPEQGSAWVERRVLSALKLHLGDKVRVGEQPLIVTRILTYEPDQQGGFSSFSPRLLFNADDLAATGVIQPGTHVHRFFQFSGSENALIAFRHFLQPQLTSAQRLLDIHEDRPELGSALTRAERFLDLASIVAVAIAGVAIAMAARRYYERHQSATALFSCFGCTRADLFQLYSLQFGMLGLGVGIGGCISGWLLQEALFTILKSLLPAATPEPGIGAFVFSLGSGLVILFGFALPPIIYLCKVPPLRVLRHDLKPLPVSALLSYSLAISVVCGLIWHFTGEIRMTASISGISLTLLLILSLWIFGLLTALRKWLPHLPVPWRLGWQSLLRERGISVGQITAFSLTLALITLSAMIRDELIDAWQQQIPQSAPNHFALNLFPDQIAAFEKSLRAKGITPGRFYPIVRGRLTRINQDPVQQHVVKGSQGDNATHRELSLTWSSSIPEENIISQGQWWKESEMNFVSVEEKLAESLQIKIGDRLTFLNGGQTFEARVSNLRSLRWESMKPNFYMIFSPGTLDAFPHTVLTSFYLPAAQKDILNDLGKEFPGMSVLEVDRIIRQLQTLFNQLTQAVNYFFYLALAASLSVLLAALYTSLDRRIHESALLRTFGASRKLLKKIQTIEFFTSGAISGIVGVLLAEALCYTLYRQALSLPYHFHMMLWLSVPLASAAGISIAGNVALRKISKKAPLRVLREL